MSEKLRAKIEENSAFIRLTDGILRRENLKFMECDHWYRWTGKMPCTGDLKCIYCGEEKEDIG